MNKNISFIDYKSRDFYFLYLENQSEEGETGHKWQEHSFFEIMLITEGESEYVIENRRYTITKGDLLLIKPGSHHYKHRVIKSPSSIYCLGFLPESIKNSGLAEKIFDKCEHISANNESAILEIFDVLKRKLEISKHNASFFIKSIAEITVLLLNDLDLDSEKAPEIKNTAVQHMLDYIKEELCNIRKVEDISKALFFSSSYTRTLFKKEMGIGIMQYVRNKKVLLAHRRIRHGEKPTEIYTDCGFSNYPSFYRAYRDYFGHSPNMQNPK
ncbi:MAG: AraC family transcriptional regulator [Ruminococcaceae bacterium]|nr:AraC family transcriptional regulator [Oscillospiraceae bacterium]